MAFTTPTTACICHVTQPRFADVDSNERTDIITMTVDAIFNGIAGSAGQNVSFPVNATTAQKQAAVRAVVNQLVRDTEPSVTLGNAAIQIIGLPV
jgi:hypothetical protein